jgi:hypothetical protein
MTLLPEIPECLASSPQSLISPSSKSLYAHASPNLRKVLSHSTLILGHIMVNIRPSSFAVLLLAATQAKALAPRTGSSGPNQKEIQWGPCEGLNGTTPLLCATLSVPLDYSDPASNAGLNIEILKIPAVNGPSKGSIFFNWGGPGAAGKDEFQIWGQRILAYETLWMQLFINSLIFVA